MQRAYILQNLSLLFPVLPAWLMVSVQRLFNATVTEGNTIEFSCSTEIEEIPSYFADTMLNSMFLSYLEYRKENGKEVKGKAIGYCIDKLESLSNSPVEKVAIIKQTIQNGWTDFFPLKGKKEKVSEGNVSSWLEREKMQSTGGVFGRSERRQCTA